MNQEMIFPSLSILENYLFYLLSCCKDMFSHLQLKLNAG